MYCTQFRFDMYKNMLVLKYASFTVTTNIMLIIKSTV